MDNLKMVTYRIINLFICVMALTLFVSVNSASAKKIAINKKNFSEDMISSVSYLYDKDDDGYLSDKEIKAAHKFTEQGCDGKVFFDFRGVEYLTSIDEIDCCGIYFKNFNPDVLRRVKKLSIIYCDNIPELDFEKMPLLEYVYLEKVEVKSSYNFKKNTKLKSLNIYECRVKKLDVSCIKNLEELGIGKGVEKFDFSKNKKLRKIKFESNWDKLDLSKNRALKRVIIINPKIKKIDLRAQKKLTELEIKGKNCKDIKLPIEKKLKILTIDAPITDFDSSKIPNIKELKIVSMLPSIELEDNGRLTDLNIKHKYAQSGEGIESQTEVKNIGSLPELKKLTLENCNIGTLNYQFPKLMYIHAKKCSMDKMDVSGLPALKGVYINSSELTDFTASENNKLLAGITFEKCKNLNNIVIKYFDSKNMNAIRYDSKSTGEYISHKPLQHVWNQETGQIENAEDMADVSMFYYSVYYGEY